MQAFDTKRRTWSQSGPYTILPEAYANNTEWTFRLYRDPDKDRADRETFGLIIGDYVHALRSALDHLAWALVTIANKRTLSKEDARRIAFPIISTHPHDFWKNPTVEHLKLKQALMIEGFQPYRAIGMEQTTPLAYLNALWNLDKHKLITPIRISLSKTESPVFCVEDARIVGEPEWDSEVALKDGTDIAWVKVDVCGSDPKVDVDRFTVDVTFGESGKPIQNLPILRDITRDIVENCVHFFE